MNEKLKTTLETLWQDEKDLLTVCEVGLRRALGLVQEPEEVAQVLRMEATQSQPSGQESGEIHLKAA